MLFFLTTRLFCTPLCSSRVPTLTPRLFASGLFLMAAPSATSGRTIQICINTWPNTIRVVSRTRWSASRPGTVNLSCLLMSKLRFILLVGRFHLQTGSKLEIWESEQKQTAHQTETLPNGRSAGSTPQNAAITVFSVSVAESKMQALTVNAHYWVLLLERVSCHNRETIICAGVCYLYSPFQTQTNGGKLQSFYLFISFVSFDLWSLSQNIIYFCFLLCNYSIDTACQW